ncbi:Bro-N domain-containing protein [Limosilactobacillus frumenti]|uniref:BRO-N domain-containing protein n=1 Tax=Limosilactobacillus frumenti TaxID=104955 RepID=UPI0015EBEF57|nr:Bro-N domain-containing protein [Limosilactobacillus frumenti]MBA2914452.1 Bro-N domain-containing protein [Limosilactobacillus frumenti]
MKLRVENWNGNLIRFIGSDNDWKAIGFDVAKALGYKRPNDALKLHVENKDKRLINLGSLLNQAETSKTGSTVKQRRTSKGGSPVMLVISEFGIYDLVFSSKMKQAKEFKRWVYQVIQQLRKQAGLQGYEAFRMLDKRIQKQAMQRLDADNEVDYIKANSIANKAISNKYGLPKMVGKKAMTPEMKRDRPTVLNDVVDLMNAKRRFGLDISVSETIYSNLEK